MSDTLPDEDCVQLADTASASSNHTGHADSIQTAAALHRGELLYTSVTVYESYHRRVWPAYDSYNRHDVDS